MPAAVWPRQELPTALEEPGFARCKGDVRAEKNKKTSVRSVLPSVMPVTSELSLKLTAGL